METTTNWNVITGAPCSGKTSVLQELEKRGFRFVPEAARVYIEEQISKGRSLQDIRANEGEFQIGLVGIKAHIEDNLPINEIIFLDRALPDSITYYRAAGLDPSSLTTTCHHYRYRNIFIFDRLPLVYDYARIEDESTVDFLDRQLEEDYRNLGYDVIRVPVMSVSERSEFIINKITEHHK